MSGTRRRCPDGHVARSSATRRARSSIAAMKGNARKIGKPPPEEPPTPAADALATDIGDIGAFRSGDEGLVVQRGACFARRSSRWLLVDALVPAAPELAVIPEAYAPSRPDPKLGVPRRAVGRAPDLERGDVAGRGALPVDPRGRRTRPRRRSRPQPHQSRRLESPMRSRPRLRAPGRAARSP